MSHLPKDCDHVMSAWTTFETINVLGERIFQYQRVCYQCPHIEVEEGAMIEPDQASTFKYAKRQEVPDAPDD